MPLANVLVLWLPVVVSAGGAPPAAKILDEMGALALASPEPDTILLRDLELAGRTGAQVMSPAERLAFTGFALRDAESRQRFALSMHASEFARFIELEGRLVAEKSIAFETFQSALHRYASNAFFTLVVGRMAVERHGEAMALALRGSINRLDPGPFEVEWFLLARQLSHLASSGEFAPFFAKGLRYREIRFGEQAKVALTTEQMLWILYAAVGPAAEQIVVAGLASKNPLEWRSAAMLAGSLLVSKAAPALTRLLSDDADPSAQIHAARSLALLFAFSAAEPLERAARSPVPEVRASALSALGELGLVRSRKVLLAALTDPSALVRRVGASSLGRHVDAPEVVSRLEKLAAGDLVASVRSSAVSTLASSPIEQATSALGRLRRSEPLPALVTEIERALQAQVLHVARGGLPPQFTFYDPDRRPIGPQPPAEARAALVRMLDQERKFSASMIGALATGLELQDIPKLEDARRLIATKAPVEALVEEMSTLNAVMRSVLAQQR